MKIITVPHLTLRQQAQPITVVDKKVVGFVRSLEETLFKKRNPRGVGLAAPQVDVLWRAFSTQLTSPTQGNRIKKSSNIDDHDADEKLILQTYINPTIIDHSDDMTFGPDKKEPILEGCLSIPGIYGPVPRWQSLKLQYQVINGTQLVSKTTFFSDFAARVVQHELDHLDGILFIDYALQFHTPLYQEDPKTQELEQIDHEFIPALVENTR